MARWAAQEPVEEKVDLDQRDKPPDTWTREPLVSGEARALVTGSSVLC